MKRPLARLIAFFGVFLLGLYFIGVDILEIIISAPSPSQSPFWVRQPGSISGRKRDYRGVVVGQVTSLDLSPTGVTIELGVNAGTHVPDNGVAEIKQLSALGEQYLDFQPSHAGGPYLQAGSVIPASRRRPTDANRYSARQPQPAAQQRERQRRADLRELADVRFHRHGPGLHQIITTGQELFDSLAAAQPETVNLIEDGNIDLHTLNATSGDFETFAKNLRVVHRAAGHLQRRLA